MGEKVELGKVEIPEDKAKWFKYVAKDGTVMAVEPKKQALSPEEKAKREAERQKKKEQRKAEGQRLRDRIKSAKEDYKKAVKDMDSAKIKSALDQVEAAEKAYQEFKGQ